MRVRVGASTDTGRVRDHNEDSLLAAAPLFAVADGMGGHEAGEVASSVAIAAVAAARAEGEPNLQTWIAGVVDDANAAVFSRGAERGGALRMGTTLTVAYAADDALYLGHVGDSRAYLLHGGRLRQVTDDHSLVAEMVREGRITAEEAAVHPQRSVITRALGIDAGVRPDTERVVPAAGDRLLLCSDGLTGMVGDAAIAEVLQRIDDPTAAAQRLIELANAGGGEDNITAVVVDVLEDPVPAAPQAQPVLDQPTQLLPPVPAPVAAAAAPSATGVITHEPPPEREPPRAVQRHARREERGSRFWLKFGIWATVFVVLVVGGWLGVTYFTTHSYYVGVDDDAVAIYQGLGANAFGTTVGSELLERTSVVVADLPDFRQQEVRDGITADSVADAEAIVARLQEQVVVTSTTQATTTTTLAPPPPVPAAAPAPAPTGGGP